jgi:hypothetical protein
MPCANTHMYPPPHMTGLLNALREYPWTHPSSVVTCYAQVGVGPKETYYSVKRDLLYPWTHPSSVVTCYAQVVTKLIHELNALREHPWTNPWSVVSVYIHRYRHTYIHTYVNACMHTYIQTYIHTYVYYMMCSNIEGVMPYNIYTHMTCILLLI